MLILLLSYLLLLCLFSFFLSFFPLFLLSLPLLCFFLLLFLTILLILGHIHLHKLSFVSLVHLFLLHESLLLGIFGDLWNDCLRMESFLHVLIKFFHVFILLFRSLLLLLLCLFLFLLLLLKPFLFCLFLLLLSVLLIESHVHLHELFFMSFVHLFFFHQSLLLSIFGHLRDYCLRMESLLHILIKDLLIIFL